MNSKFRTTEISNSEYESNNLRFITVKTPNLKGRGDVCVFVPPFKNLKDIPIVTLLHGVYGSAWIWSQKAGVHLTALKMMEQGLIKPMVIAMPSDGLWGDGSAYLPHHNYNFESWIVNDVIDVVRENINCVSNNSDLFIAGLSMGGYGALRLGVKYHDRFKAISSHSSLTNTNQMHLFVEEKESDYFKNMEVENDLFELMKRNKEMLPSIRFDCGKADLLIEYNRILHDNLINLGVKHSYQEFEGKHEWSYWQEHIKDTLIFFNSLI
ncbi:alpha/beta hydrolase [Algibacter mikhailovii]|uniref:Endo-1,4-beta-xylanase n=1 Tax=Algibacter mikhailovii TaxID=425498 RepID=A0A918V4F3_9FLAO|nr:alpha/beta hydrolase-fold protein [Algibacter mikhailovii]GGZ68030.1 endo-1,4-beta-xylanase [Algibacter mikhailovii]